MQLLNSKQALLKRSVRKERKECRWMVFTIILTEFLTEIIHPASSLGVVTFVVKRVLIEADVDVKERK